MKTSQRGIDLIKQSEGFKAEAYLCPAGVWTIGYGSTEGVTAGMRITEMQGEQRLIMDVAKAESQLNGLNLRLRQSQFDALIDFIYNLGFSAFLRSGLLAMIRVNPDSSNIPTEFRKWRLAAGKPLTGLINRREAEIRLFQSII